MIKSYKLRNKTCTAVSFISFLIMVLSFLSATCKVWIMGDSYIRHGEQRAKETVRTDPGVSAYVQWFERGGMCWDGLLLFFHQCLKRRTAPDVLVIHCGDNDLEEGPAWPPPAVSLDEDYAVFYQPEAPLEVRPPREDGQSADVCEQCDDNLYFVCQWEDCASSTHNVWQAWAISKWQCSFKLRGKWFIFSWYCSGSERPCPVRLIMDFRPQF